MSMNRSFVESVQTPGALPPEELAKAQSLYEDILLQTDSTRITGRLARTYAQALMEVATRNGEVEPIREQLESLLREVLPASPQLEQFLDSPAVNRKAKADLIQKVFGDGRSTQLFLDFLLLLNSRDRIGLVRMIAIAYRTLYEKQANQQRVLIESATELSEESQKQLEETLGNVLNKKPILVVRVRPELLGGLVIHFGDKVFDTTVRTKLTNIRNLLMARGNHAIQTGRDRFGYN